MKFIFKIKIKEGCTEEQYLNAWTKGSEVIQQSEGAEGTTLYRNEKGELLAIASWESKEKRDAAMERLKADQTTEEVRNKHREFGETEILGNFEEIGRVQLTK